MEIGEDTLTLTGQDDGSLQDKRTESTWDRATGIASAGSLRGKRMEQCVGIISYRQAWQAFHPGSKEFSRP